MFLAVDVGNTNVVFCLFSGEKLVEVLRRPTENFQFPKLQVKIRITGVAIASVVPSLDRKLISQIRTRFNVEPIIVTAGNIPGLKVKVKKPHEVGADRVVNAYAALKMFGGPCIVVDFGTATTFDVVSAKGEYLGGAIAPGIYLARDALYSRTAKLPKVKIEQPKKLIGDDTVSAIQSGLVWGYVSLVEGMVRKLKAEKPISREAVRVVATGGLAPLICKLTKVVDTIDVDLTLKGLRMIGEGIKE